MLDIANLPHSLRCLYSARKTLKMSEARHVFVISSVLLLLLLPTHAHAYNKRRDGPPVRPGNFRSVAELQKYLSELTDYYTVLGRPRFGKRSSPMASIDFEPDTSVDSLKRRFFKGPDFTPEDLLLRR